jgi:hypothetical protein
MFMCLLLMKITLLVTIRFLSFCLSLSAYRFGAPVFYSNVYSTMYFIPLPNDQSIYYRIFHKLGQLF